MRLTPCKASIQRLNNLQSNYSTLLEQEKSSKNLPLLKFEHQKELIKRIDNGKVYKALKKVPIIHVAGTKGKGNLILQFWPDNCPLK